MNGYGLIGQWFQGNLDIVFFVYGLAFMLMGIVILVQPRKASGFKLTGILWLLGLFGITHGLNEFLDMWAIVKGRHPALDLVRLGVLIPSFYFLFEFGRQLFRLSGLGSDGWRKRIALLLEWWLMPVIGLFIIIAALMSHDFWETGSIWTRYILGFSGNLLTALGLVYYYEYEKYKLESVKVKSFLLWAGIAFFIYGVLGGLVVPAGHFFPADWINVESFLSATGIPVQVFRAACAIIIAVSIGRILNAFNHKRTEQLLKFITLKEKTTEEYQTILRTALDGFWIIDMQGRFLDVNDAYCRMVEYSRDQLLKMSIADVEAYQSPQEIVASIRTVMEHGSGRFEVNHRSKSGPIITIELSINYLKDQGRFFVFGHDITRRKRIDKELSDAYDKLNNSMKVLGQHNLEINLLTEMYIMLQVSLTTDEAYKVVGEFLPKLYPENPGGLYIFNPSRNLAEPVIVWGKNTAEDSVFSPEDCWAVRLGRAYMTINTADTQTGCLHHKKVSGALFCVPLISQGEVLGVLSVEFSQADMEPHKKTRLGQKKYVIISAAEHIGPALANLKLREKLRDLSVRDHLTGLFNRRYMEESLERELFRAQRKDSSIGIIMMDIDKFKDFNDHFGHDRGDGLMQVIGKFLRDNIRESDIACRYGGEEFILIMPDASLESTLQRAEYLRESFKQLPHQGNEGVTISMGVAAYPMHGITAAEIIKAADMALYRAKESGRDRVNVAPAPPQKLE
ncbi:MAG: diguanylate cyclase [Candidatus Brocadiia bacterium]